MRRRNGAGARGNVRVLLLLRALLLLLVLPYFPKKVSADPSCSKECAHAGVCEGKDGTCFMAPDYAVDGWATEGGCEAGGSAWCGDSLGKRLCAARMPRDNYDGIALPDARGELNENCNARVKPKLAEILDGMDEEDSRRAHPKRPRRRGLAPSLASP